MAINSLKTLTAHPLAVDHNSKLLKLATTKFSWGQMALKNKSPKLSKALSSQCLTAKYALFTVYISTLGLTSYPSLNGNSRLSSLKGVSTRRGKRCLNTQRWVWLVGPLWSAWSVWFDALVGVFTAKGVCVAHGPASVELLSRAFTWLTLGKTTQLTNFASKPWGCLYDDDEISDGNSKLFYLLLQTPRYWGRIKNPVFALSGSNTRARTGWASLPGPDTNAPLKQFILLASLVAYKTSLRLKA